MGEKRSSNAQQADNPHISTVVSAPHAKLIKLLIGIILTIVSRSVVFCNIKFIYLKSALSQNIDVSSLSPSLLVEERLPNFQDQHPHLPSIF